MLLLDSAAFDQRRRALSGPLASLRDSLAQELAPALARDLYIPQQKALLSRAGGRCERDGANLEFDPFNPKSHRCGVCGATYTGELHERAWNTWYHLWLAERAVHAALFNLFAPDDKQAAFASSVLRAYADAYLTYPNRDNVLGPTRPFFSTYLESIWLLQLCIASDLTARAGDTATADLVRDRVIKPSSDLIASFNEGASNRQVWNNAALLAAALLLNDRDRAEAIVRVKTGVADHLSHALLGDGTWYEGDNYHQFAIRGLWYAVAMCEANELELAIPQVRAFDRGVAATFASALPDFTFPSRKDSQYAVSLRQWRFAELAEVGFARNGDPQLGAALARCYEPGHAKLDTGRSRSTADAERHAPSSLLTRSDLGWRALLHAYPELPKVEPVEPRSIHLTGQGLAVFRRPGQVYAALDYGQTGAGHGHPDRLNLLLAQGSTRWLDDLGTGSYVDKSLHWYRSSLAHNAPFVNGRSQRSADGRLLAYDELGDLGWVEAQFSDGDVRLTRTVVISPRYLIDELAWSAPTDVQIDLPWHVDGVVADIDFTPTDVDGGDGLEDGFDFTKEWRVAAMPRGEPVRMSATLGASQLAITFLTKSTATLLRAAGPGQPASKLAPFYMVRLHGGQGRLRTVVAWDLAATVEFDGEHVRVGVGENRDTHSRIPAGWRVETTAGRSTKAIDLLGRVTTKASAAATPSSATRTRIVQPANFGGWWSDLPAADKKRLHVIELGERNYRRSEESWAEAGSPSATIAVSVADGTLELFIDVRAAAQRFAPGGAINRLDNEHADTMGAGVQLYVGTNRARGMWMLVPEVGGTTVRVREIRGSTHPRTPVARWRPRDGGYELHVVIPPAPLNEHMDLTVVINEAVEGRERRRGQLVTSDARGQFVYLRGDREDPSRDLHFEVTL